MKIKRKLLAVLVFFGILIAVLAVFSIKNIQAAPGYDIENQNGELLMPNFGQGCGSPPPSCIGGCNGLAGSTCCYTTPSGDNCIVSCLGNDGGPALWGSPMICPGSRVCSIQGISGTCVRPVPKTS